MRDTRMVQKKVDCWGLHRLLFLQFISEEIHKFLIDTFTVNTLQEILPYSEKESEGDFDR